MHVPKIIIVSQIKNNHLSRLLELNPSVVELRGIEWNLLVLALELDLGAVSVLVPVAPGAPPGTGVSTRLGEFNLERERPVYVKNIVSFRKGKYIVSISTFNPLMLDLLAPPPHT